MNKEECVKSNCGHNEYWKLVQHKLKLWKKDNGLQGRYVVHHRDDTDECRKYNEEHYERWGFNEDGSFEYGKYIVFMAQSEHVSYHNKGKIFSEEYRAKLSANHSHYWKGKERSEETCAKLSAKVSATLQVEKVLYATYKNNGGTLKWNDFRKALKNGDIPLDATSTHQ